MWSAAGPWPSCGRTWPARTSSYRRRSSRRWTRSATETGLGVQLGAGLHLALEGVALDVLVVVEVVLVDVLVLVLVVVVVVLVVLVVLELVVLELVVLEL